ncbi:MAG: Tyrosine-tRNA ligase [Parcubacteria group bacterium GW2011_GWA1_Parcubacteria_45_10]|nr:MAG: Tyrosine-tRNA ligase [Parcubacteria group bacterium GW2011_GWA1_Parcubacteria_45_10]
MRNDFFEELKWRGLLFQAIKFGHKPIILAASGTTMVGDPSGKEKERPVLSRQEIEKNKKSIKRQIQKILRGEKFLLLDNHDWLGKLKLLEFLRDAGKHITLNSMLDKESVKTRLGRESGISFAEFSYQLLQAYDFLYLFEKRGCQAQVAGSDQWGNMVQGVDLIRKKLAKQAAALSWPLIEDPQTGKKFGKSAVGKTIWLDPEKTHPFEFYQFFVGIEDSLAPRLAKYFSFKNQIETLALEKKWQEKKEGRKLQKELAFEMTVLVHGKLVAEEAKKVSELVYDKAKDENLDLKDIEFVKTALPYAKTAKKPGELTLEEGLYITGLTSSMTASRYLVQQNGATGKILFKRFFWIRKGKRDVAIVEFLEQR